MSVKDLLARPDIVPNPYDIAASELGTPYKAYGKAPLRKEADNSAADLWKCKKELESLQQINAELRKSNGKLTDENISYISENKNLKFTFEKDKQLLED